MLPSENLNRFVQEGGRLVLAEAIHREHAVKCPVEDCRGGFYNKDSGGKSDSTGRPRRRWKCRGKGAAGVVKTLRAEDDGTKACGKSVGNDEYISVAKAALGRTEFDCAVTTAKLLCKTIVDDGERIKAARYLSSLDSSPCPGEKRKADIEGGDDGPGGRRDPVEGADPFGVLPYREATEAPPRKKYKVARTLRFGGSQVLDAPTLASAALRASVPSPPPTERGGGTGYIGDSRPGHSSKYGDSRKFADVWIKAEAAYRALGALLQGADRGAGLAAEEDVSGGLTDARPVDSSASVTGTVVREDPARPRLVPRRPGGDWDGGEDDEANDRADDRADGGAIEGDDGEGGGDREEGERDAVAGGGASLSDATQENTPPELGSPLLKSIRDRVATPGPSTPPSAAELAAEFLGAGSAGGRKRIREGVRARGNVFLKEWNTAVQAMQAGKRGGQIEHAT